VSVLEARRDSPVDGPAASETTPDEDAARRLLQRHASALGRVTDPRARRQRAYALLARHGFGPDICRQVASAWLEAGGQPGLDADGGQPD
jgi:RecX, third three-helix domain